MDRFLWLKRLKKISLPSAQETPQMLQSNIYGVVHPICFQNLMTIVKTESAKIGGGGNAR